MEFYTYPPLLATNGITPQPGAPVQFFLDSDTTFGTPLQVFGLDNEPVVSSFAPISDLRGYINNAGGYRLQVRNAVAKSLGNPAVPVFSIQSILEDSAASREAAELARQDALEAAQIQVAPIEARIIASSDSKYSGLGHTHNYSDLTGTVPTSALPPLAINETFPVASQAAMLALTAQRGDMTIRTDNGRTYVLASDSPTTLADWKEVQAAGQVTSVAGRSGTVVLAKADVGLSAVDNTSDANKPVSTAQQTALNGKANSSHPHTSSAITDFTEAVQDLAGNMIIAGTGLTGVYDDAAGVYRISASAVSAGNVSLTGTYAARPAASTLREGDRYLATDVGPEEYVVVGGAWMPVGGKTLRGLTELSEIFNTTSTGWADVPNFLVTFVAGERPVRLTLECDLAVSAGNNPVRASIWLAGALRAELRDFHPYGDKWQTVSKSKTLYDLIPGTQYTASVRLTSNVSTATTRMDGNSSGNASNLIVEAI